MCVLCFAVRINVFEGCVNYNHALERLFGQQSKYLQGRPSLSFLTHVVEPHRYFVVHIVQCGYDYGEEDLGAEAEKVVVALLLDSRLPDGKI